MSTVTVTAHAADQPADTPPAVAPPEMTYTPQRYAVLRATARNLIVATPGGVLERADGLDLDQDVFAALAALHTAGYLQPHPGTPPAPPPRTAPATPKRPVARAALPSGGSRVPVRLTLRGWGLLDRFHLEHGRRAATSAAAAPDVRTATPPSGEHQPRGHVRQPHVPDTGGVDQP